MPADLLASESDRIPEPPAYRAMILDQVGNVLSNASLPARDDEVAKAQARTLVDGHAVELWDGLRFIEHFDPDPSAS